jgi:uncharacterized protein
MSIEKPLPRITPDNKPFFEALRRHELSLPWCGDCGKPHLPPGPVCPFCFSDLIEWRKASGRGKITTWVVVHKEWFPAFKAETPYNAVQVELTEGPRLTTNVVGARPDQLSVGRAVEAVFDDVKSERTLLRFKLA